MHRTTIDWPTNGHGKIFTWGIVHGCLRGCGISADNPRGWCYARRIHERFNKTPFTDVVFHPEKLQEPVRHKKPAVIFVGSATDPEYWEDAWWEKNYQLSLNDKNINRFWVSCALCKLFYSSNCEGCPVFEKTGEAGCKGTPYSEASGINPASVLAKVNFLKSLLPK